MRSHLLLITLAALGAGCQRQSATPSADRDSRVEVTLASASTPPDDSPAPESPPPKTESNKSAKPTRQPQMGRGTEQGRGRGFGRGFGRGPGAMSGRRADMTTIHSMFASSDKITRTVKILPDGAEAKTESDDKEIASLIQQHVPSMENRVLGNEPLPPMTFHPVFVELIKNNDKYTMDYEDTDKGVKVVYTADNPYVVMLVQEHAKLVSRFLKNGMREIHEPYELPELPDSAARKMKAITAKEALFKRLSSRLTEVMQSKGPAAAIEVCSSEASKIAKAVGDEQGVAIGRTSLKLRNPANQPPNWVKPLIAKTETPPSESQFVELPKGHTGALLPITLQAKCLTCHGEDDIPPSVTAKLGEIYPNDEATGFKIGDLRGWFWVDVPPGTSKPSTQSNLP